MYLTKTVAKLVLIVLVSFQVGQGIFAKRPWPDETKWTTPQYEEGQ